MTEIKIFENEQFGEIRTINQNEELWFVAADVCRALDISNPSVALERLDDDERAKFNLGRQGETNAVNEPGLYSLVLGSRKPEAKAFKRWITHEVIPSIRQTGGYIAGQETLDDDSLLEKALTIAMRRIEEREKKLQEAAKENALLKKDNERKTKEIETLQPKASYVDAILRCRDPLRIRIIARDYGWSGQRMNNWLCEHGIQYKQSGVWLLHQKYAGKGYTVQQTFHYTDYYGNEHAAVHTSWTQSGRFFIYEQLKKHGILPEMELYNQDHSGEADYNEVYEDDD